MSNGMERNCQKEERAPDILSDVATITDMEKERRGRKVD